MRRRIGSGAFATVWLAYDEHLDSAGRDQGPRGQLDRRPPHPPALPRGGPLPPQGRVAPRRDRLRRRRAGRRAPLPRDGVRRPGHAGRPSRARAADAVAGAVGDHPGRSRAHRPPRPRRAAPRREARQRAVPHRRERPRRARRGDARRPRPRQGDGHVLAPHHGRRHPVLRRPRAGPRRGAGRAGRPVLARRAELPPARRSPALRPREPRGRREPRAARADGDRRPGGGGGGPPRSRQGPRRPVPRRRVVHRRPRGRPWASRWTRRRGLDPGRPRPDPRRCQHRGDRGGERPAAARRPARRRRRWPWVAAAVLALAAGTGAGWALERTGDLRAHASRTRPARSSSPCPSPGPRRSTPSSGSRSRDGPEQPSLAAGTRSGWNSDDDPGEGVFVGILPGDKLPSRVPGHADVRGPARPLLRREGTATTS